VADLTNSLAANFWRKNKQTKNTITGEDCKMTSEASQPVAGTIFMTSHSNNGRYGLLGLICINRRKTSKIEKELNGLLYVNQIAMISLYSYKDQVTKRKLKLVAN
jgi:hypothetical protein